MAARKTAADKKAEDEKAAKEAAEQDMMTTQEIEKAVIMPPDAEPEVKPWKEKGIRRLATKDHSFSKTAMFASIAYSLAILTIFVKAWVGGLELHPPTFDEVGKMLRAGYWTFKTTPFDTLSWTALCALVSSTYVGGKIGHKLADAKLQNGK